MGIFDFSKDKNVSAKCVYYNSDQFGQHWCKKGTQRMGMPAQIAEKHFNNHCNGNYLSCSVYNS